MVRNNEWSEEHETIFVKMLKKAHSVNTVAKTRMFKEYEKNLNTKPEKLNNRYKEWKYDKHSP